MMYNLYDFLEPINVEGMNDEFTNYNPGQIAHRVDAYIDELPEIKDADIVIAGVCETRGNPGQRGGNEAPDLIRRQLYQLYDWHSNMHIADIGNIKTGASLNDSYAAIKTVLSELISQNKTVVLIGGSHDNTLAQYLAYKKLQRIVEATCVDSSIDLKGESSNKSESFLLEMLTTEPNLVSHYNHIGFQSYYVNPRMLETMDKLRFDCFRVGKVKEDIEEMEPVLRSTNMLSFDISAIKYSDAPCNQTCPNGLTGEEACTLTRYAGMSAGMSSIGIYGYDPQADLNDLTARQIAQMLWYFIDGRNRSKEEALIDERASFNEYHTAFAEIDTLFLQSKKSRRWWMQLPNKKFIACSYKDYLDASRNEIPERWLRQQERS